MMHILTHKEYTDLLDKASDRRLKAIELFQIMLPVFKDCCIRHRKSGKSIATVIEQAVDDMMKSLPNWPGL